MITESKVTEIFCIADDFCKEFEVEMAKNSLPSSPDAPKRRRKRMMSDAEVITILICFHFNTYRNFKHYYLSCVCGQWKHLFPRRFSYNRFVEVMPRCFVALTMFLRLACFGECTGISFVDSTCIPVIHNKREFNMKVFKGIAAKGKSTMEWYVGFKLHLLCNEKGELVNFVLTRANVDDREVRAVWDDENNCWWFSATDVVRAINDEPDYTKAGNYWRWLKRKLKQESVQFVSGTHKLKIVAADGKQYNSDALSAEDIVLLAKHYPNNRASKFLDWFTYSDNTIDGQSRKKAYTLFESGLLNSLEPGSMKCLQQIHAYLFGGLYDFAGQIRNKNISKGGFTFANCLHFPTIIPTIECMPETTLDEIADKYVEMNVVHPFMEGNGRSTRIWLDLMLRRSLKHCVDWSLIDKNEYLTAMRESVVDTTHIKALLKGALTDKINDREMFMKGIDYSYYYEEE